MAFLVLVGGVQFLYCVVAGNYVRCYIPYLSKVLSFVLAITLHEAVIRKLNKRWIHEC